MSKNNKASNAKSETSNPALTAAQQIEQLKAQLAALETQANAEKEAARVELEAKINGLPAYLGLADLGTVMHAVTRMVKTGTLKVEGKSIKEGERTRVVLTDAQWMDVEKTLKTSAEPMMARCRALSEKFGCSFQTIYLRAKSIGLVKARAETPAAPAATAAK